MSTKAFMIEPTGEHTPFLDSVSHSIWRRLDTGEEFYGKDPVGAMWYCPEDQQQHYAPGPDGRTLFVQTPGGVWNIDSRGSNCTLPDDDEHRCWVRHGVPPEITVDKVGKTCAAGAGSILIGDYHGFLQNGYLT